MLVTKNNKLHYPEGGKRTVPEVQTLETPSMNVKETALYRELHVSIYNDSTGFSFTFVGVVVEKESTPSDQSDAENSFSIAVASYVFLK